MINNNFIAVNSGGCACIASMLSEVLRDKFPIIRVVSNGEIRDSDIDIDNIRTNISDTNDRYQWENNGIEFDHVWLEVYYKGRWYGIDSTGVKPRQQIYKRWGKACKGSFTYNEIKALADTHRGWNPVFNREQIPNIKQYIRTTIKPLIN